MEIEEPRPVKPHKVLFRPRFKHADYLVLFVNVVALLAFILAMAFEEEIRFVLTIFGCTFAIVTVLLLCTVIDHSALFEKCKKKPNAKSYV